MLQVMQDKRKAQEAANASLMADQPAQPTGETMEERATRLKAQRDLLRRQKEEKRQRELDDFNNQMEQAKTAPNLADEFRQMDANKQLPSNELDRRREIYKNVRKDILKTDQANKEKAIQEKMRSMELKVQ